MPCYHPLPCWYAKKRNENGKRSVVFSLAEGDERRPLSVPCGTCIGCKLERSRQWALRCVHESKLYRSNCFITLTYSDENLPAGGSLVPSNFVDFMKRLRWHWGEGIRFFHCGEYGENLGRPHHHAILFNHGFPDCRKYKESNGVKLYVSRELEKLWPHGMCVVGDASFESAAYVARYALKKVVGPSADSWYQGRVPEYLTMSRRPGIGRGFFEKFRGEIYRDDSCIVRGKVSKPPRYYDAMQEKVAPSVLKRIKARRLAAALADVENSGHRLVEREEVKNASMVLLSRGLERGL